ncbi:MAG: hypothetical protein NTX91_00210 [candidate division SR1 bacterium]|nr:hypothetical protein [candidate division SR1 bacterium]
MALIPKPPIQSIKVGDIHYGRERKQNESLREQLQAERLKNESAVNDPVEEAAFRALLKKREDERAFTRKHPILAAELEAEKTARRLADKKKRDAKKELAKKKLAKQGKSKKAK